jgi:Ca-activated chloride channel family protein
MWRPSVSWMLLVGALGTAAAFAAPRQDSPAAVFRSQSDLVVLHVNVFDGHSDAVPDLPREAFLVIEDNTAQEITFFSGADVPVAVGLAIDNSGSMIARRAMVVAGGQSFAASSHPEDELFTVIFNEHVRYGLPPVLLFTTNQSHLQAALTRYPPGGKTALHDAVIAGLDRLEQASLQKHVLVVLSDGDDNASEHSEKEMLERARRSDAIIYAVSSEDSQTGLGGDPGVLKKLAETTGGLAYFPKSEGGVVNAFNEIAQNIRRGYSIGYVPTNTARDGAFRKVKVMIRVRGKNNFSVRSRRGYTAPGANGTR